MGLRCTACELALEPNADRCPRCLRQSTVEETRPGGAARPGFPRAGFVALGVVAWLFHLAVVGYVSEERWLAAHRAQATGFRLLVGLLLLAIYGSARALGTWGALGAMLAALLGAALVLGAVFGVAIWAHASLDTGQTALCFALALGLIVGLALVAARYLRDE